MPDKMETVEERAKQFSLDNIPPDERGEFADWDFEHMAQFARSEIRRFAEEAAKVCNQLNCQGKCHEDDAKQIRALASRYTNGGG